MVAPPAPAAAAASGAAGGGTRVEANLKDLNLSSEEVGKFEKAFKDPEFLKLFAEYAKEVSDPKAKEETDQYLRQLERQGRAEEVYGKGVQLIVPEECFVIKAKQAGGRGAGKVFINVCTSDKIAAVQLRDAKDAASGKVGKHVDLPLSLGGRKEGKDKTGEPCSVYDFVVHPDTVKFARGSPAAMKLLAETAIEHVESSGKVPMGRVFKVLASPHYKATEAAAKPQVLSIRGKEGGEAIDGRLKPLNAGPADLPPGAEPAAAAAPVASSDGAAAAAGSTPRSSFAFPAPRGTAAKAQKGAASAVAVADPAQPGFRHVGGEVTPSWEVVHRGTMDLSEAWGDAGRGLHVGGTHPKELLVRVQLPDMTSAAGVDLDVSARRLALAVPARYLLEVELPFAVDGTKGRAKFDKARRQLEVALPVVPPQLPPPRHASVAASAADAAPAADEPLQQQQQQQQQEEVEDGSSSGAGAELEGNASSSNSPGATGAQALTEEVGKVVEEQRLELGVPTADAAGGTLAAAGGQVDADAAGADDGDKLTENQRRWNELHKRAGGEEEGTQGAHGQRACGQEGASEGSACCEGAGAAAQLPAPQHEGCAAAPALAAPRDLGGQPAVGSAAAAAAACGALPVKVTLRPRLNHGMVAELD